MRSYRRFRAAGPTAGSRSPGNDLLGLWGPVVFCLILRHSPLTWSMVRFLSDITKIY
jgi:hypothetical protein